VQTQVSLLGAFTNRFYGLKRKFQARRLAIRVVFAVPDQVNHLALGLIFLSEWFGVASESVKLAQRKLAASYATPELSYTNAKPFFAHFCNLLIAFSRALIVDKN
jgi:hypothetical protein